jgi:hypothetical protein
VPVTVASTFYSFDTNTPTFSWLMLGIGNNQVQPPTQPPPPQGGMGFWYVVLSLTDLSVVVNEFDNTWTGPANAVPAALKPYVGNSNYFLIFVTHVCTVASVPQGDLYTMLMDVGAGPVALPSAEQLFATLGSENVRSFSYALAATLDTGDDKGIEDVSFNGRAILNFQFMPVIVEGQTKYVPIRLG